MKLRTGGWNAAQRRKLSAIRAPHRNDPAAFYFDGESAAAELATAGEVPSTLTVGTELARQQRLAGARGVSWRDPAGRCFTDEYWNPLVALWVARGGWELVFDLVLPDPATPWKNGFSGGDPAAAWYAVRRYLHRADEAAYAGAVARVAPAFERAARSDSYDDTYAASAMAFAFDRDPAWALRLLGGYERGEVAPPRVDLLAAVCPDVALSQRVAATFGGLREVYFVFDMVETLDARALPLLATIKTSRAPDRKRVATAVGIAEKLA
jgi:hypothetical protein